MYENTLVAFSVILVLVAVSIQFVYSWAINSVAKETRKPKLNADTNPKMNHHALAFPQVHLVSEDQIPVHQDIDRQKLWKTTLIASKSARRIHNTLLFLLLVPIFYLCAIEQNEDIQSVLFAVIGSGFVYIFSNVFIERLVGDYREGYFGGKYTFLLFMMPPFAFYGFFLAILAEKLGIANGAIAVLVIIYMVRLLNQLLFALFVSKRFYPLNLLVLRAFGDSQRTQFYIHRLQHLWNGAGSTFILYSDDYSEAAGDFRFIRFILVTTLSIVILTVLAIVLIQNAISEEHWSIAVVGTLLPITMYAISIITLKSELRKYLIADQVTLQKRLKSAVKSFFGGQYYTNPYLHFHQDYRKQAISDLVSRSHVIIMDLRGLVSENADIISYLDILAQEYPLCNVLFLTDATTNVDYAIECIHDSWKLLPYSSPNFKTPPPFIYIYDIKQPPKREISSLIAWLCEIVSLEDKTQKNI